MQLQVDEPFLSKRHYLADSSQKYKEYCKHGVWVAGYWNEHSSYALRINLVSMALLEDTKNVLFETNQIGQTCFAYPRDKDSISQSRKQDMKVSIHYKPGCMKDSGLETNT